MAAEYGGGRLIPVFDDSHISYVDGYGEFSDTVRLTLRLYLMNEAGLSYPSDPVSINIPSTTAFMVSFPEENRNEVTGYKYCFLVGTKDTISNGYILGFWRIFNTDSESFCTNTELIFFQDEHIETPPPVLNDFSQLPTGDALVPGMTRLILNAPSGSSYYLYHPWLITDPNSPYFRHLVDQDQVISKTQGENWIRFGSPQFGLFPVNNDLYDVGGCCRPMIAIDPEILNSSLLFLSNYTAPDDSDILSPHPLTVYFSSDTGNDIKAGSRFGLKVEINGSPFTSLMSRRIVIRFLGFYDPITDTLDTDSGLNDGTLMTGIGVDLYQDSPSTGFLALPKTLPGNQKAVFKIYPRFKSSEMYPPLLDGTIISVLLVLLPQSGVRVPLATALQPSQGGFVSSYGDRGRVIPDDGGVKILSGVFVVKGFESSPQPVQSIIGFTPNTLNQQLSVTQDGYGVCRGVYGVESLPPSEALLALVDFGQGETQGIWTSPFTVDEDSGIQLTLTYPLSNGLGIIRSELEEIGGQLTFFNPPYVRVYLKKDGVVYRANSPIMVSYNTEGKQIISVLSMTNYSQVGDLPSPPFSDFGFFDPPGFIHSDINGNLEFGLYQVAVTYAYTTGTQCTRIRQSTENGCIPAYSEPLFDVQSGMKSWGTAIIPSPSQSTLDALKSIPLSQRHAWQTRRLQGGTRYYYNPISSDSDNGISIIKPNDIITQGRWILDQSNQWHIVNGIPSNSVGLPGDLAIDLAFDVGNVYQKQLDNTWSLVGNLKGSPGLAGYSPQVFSSVGIPDNSLGYDNDICFDSSSITLGNVYVKINGEWVLQLNIRGETGQSGGIGGSFARFDELFTTSVIQPGMISEGIFTLGKSFQLLEMTTSAHCWVRLYSTANHRTLDNWRSDYNTAPSSFKGLVLDMESSESIIDSGFGCNLDDPVSTNIYYSVQNLTTTAQAFNITFTRILWED